MKSLKLLIIVIILLVSFSHESYSKNDVRFSEISNLTYQLDCVSNQRVPCSSKNFGELWKTEFVKNETDVKMISEWGKLRKFNSKYVSLRDDKNNRFSNLNLFEKIRIAGLQANDVNDYLSRLDLLVSPQERAGFEKVIRHFYPKYKVWWDKNVAQKGKAFQLETKELLDSEVVSKQINNFINFYSPSLTPNYNTSFNLLYVPNTLKESTNGQQIDNYSLIEFKFDEKPKERIDVVIHELCHFYYGNISQKNKSKLSESFLSMNSPLAVPAYNLLNESLATSFGNGMIVRSLVSKERYEKFRARANSFYNNLSIDKTAKATIPMLDEFISKGKTIHSPDFAKRYISELGKVFSKDEITPRLYLFEMSFVIDGELEDIPIFQVNKAVGATSIFRGRGNFASKEIAEDLQRTATRNSVIIVKPKNLKELVNKNLLKESVLKSINKRFEKEKIAIFNKQRKNYINAYIIVADNNENALKALNFLGKSKQFVGLNKILTIK